MRPFTFPDAIVKPIFTLRCGGYAREQRMNNGG